MRLLRKHRTPLATDSNSGLALPPVRVGLLAKLNVLTLGILALALVATSAFYFAREERNEAEELRGHGAAVVLMLATVAERGLGSANRGQVNRLIDHLDAEDDIAYAAILNAEGHPLIERRLSTAVGNGPLPPFDPGSDLTPGKVRVVEHKVSGAQYVELIARVDDKPALPSAASAPPDDPADADNAAPLVSTTAPGYVRVGMLPGRSENVFGSQLAESLAVAALLFVAAVVATMLLTRRIVAPMGLLSRAARAVGAGKLDVQVPVRSSDELGLLTHAFNHMTQRLAKSQAEVANYQRTLEDKVTQRTEELQIATAHAYKLAQHDILTGLPNRSLLNQRLWQILAQAHRDGNHVACLFLDFDHFKRINDTLGHDAGDQLLQAIAERLTGAVREADTVARLGGDEFIVILPGLDPAHATSEILTVLARVRESFLAPFKVGDQVPTLTCSIGVSMYPLDANDAVSMIKEADTAMYAAKDAGRNTYRFYTADMNASVRQRLQIETDMRRGLIDNEFFLVYQPQIDLQSGRACGVEALLRWRDPVRGVIGPAEFIPVAEESGMILALGAWVLREACGQVAQWHRAGMQVRLSVNLSVHQLQHDRLPSILTDALASSGLAAQYLDLEITESVIITHPEKAVATLIKLREVGVSVTVDDFGTGYSSLSYLARLPIQGVKIDQRFIAGIETNKSDAMITQGIIALSHSLSLRVIAEGVETRAQYDLLKKLGCEEGQGFLMSGPLDTAALEVWWQKQAGPSPAGSSVQRPA